MHFIRVLLASYQSSWRWRNRTDELELTSPRPCASATDKLMAYLSYNLSVRRWLKLLRVRISAGTCASNYFTTLLTFGHLLCCRPFTWEDSRLRIVHDYDDRCLPMSTTTLPDGERVTTEWYPMVIYVPSAADSSLEDSRLRIVYDYDD